MRKHLWLLLEAGIPFFMAGWAVARYLPNLSYDFVTAILCAVVSSVFFLICYGLYRAYCCAYDCCEVSIVWTWRRLLRGMRAGWKMIRKVI